MIADVIESRSGVNNYPLRVSESSCKWGVHSLHERELHNLDTFITVFRGKLVSVIAVTAFTASYHILGDAIFSRYCQPINRGGTLL